MRVTGEGKRMKRERGTEGGRETEQRAVMEGSLGRRETAEHHVSDIENKGQQWRGVVRSDRHRKKKYFRIAV